MRKLFSTVFSLCIVISLTSCEKEDQSDSSTKQSSNNAEYAYSPGFGLNVCFPEDSDGNVWFGVFCDLAYRSDCPDQLECTPLLEYGTSPTDFGTDLASIYGYDKVDDFIDDLNDGVINITDKQDGVDFIVKELEFED